MNLRHCYRPVLTGTLDISFVFHFFIVPLQTLITDITPIAIIAFALPCTLAITFALNGGDQRYSKIDKHIQEKNNITVTIYRNDSKHKT